MPATSSSLTIAQVLPAGAGPYSGITTVVIELARRLSAMGHAVELWPLSPWESSDRGATRDELQAAGISMIDGFPTLAHRLAALRKRSVDVAHLHSVFTPPNTVLAGLLRAPYVLTPHGGYNRASLARSTFRKRVYAALAERRLVRNAAAVIALTELEREDIADFAGASTITVIPNGVSAPTTPASDGKRFRREHGIGEDTPLLVFVGRLDIRHKGLDFVVQALSEAPQWTCAVVGPNSSDGASTLRHMARERGVLDRFLHVGPAHGKELSDALAAADVFVLLSRWEGLPMSLLEAVAHGVPSLVSTQVDELVPVAAAGAGWAVEPEKAGRMLAQLATDRGRDFAAESAAARTLAKSYDWGAVADEYQRLFRAVAEESLQ